MTNSMNRENANQVAKMFDTLTAGSAIDVLLNDVGYNDGKYWHVVLRFVNAKTGNRTSASIGHVPDEKEAKLIVKKLVGKAKDKDLQTLARMEAERNAK